MIDQTRPAPDSPAEAYPAEWLAAHLAEERRRVALLGDIREVVFGTQDGLVSILTVVATVAGATLTTFPILVAGVAAGLAGVFSMAAGEYVSSKSQRELFEAQIAGEVREVAERPGEAEAEVAFLLAADGLPAEDARLIAGVLARYPGVLTRTMVEKELGLTVEDKSGPPLQGAVLMGAAFGAGAVLPLLPFLLLPVRSALVVAVVLAGVALFGVGVAKSRLTERGWARSGLEVLALGACAGIAGYLFGTALPGLLGLAGVGA
jgi:VIT1/CCC1 family predicted Fe2+/Mn2+ transporter